MKIDNFIIRENKDGNVAAAEVTFKNNKERKIMKLIMITIMSLQKKTSYMPKTS